MILAFLLITILSNPYGLFPHTMFSSYGIDCNVKRGSQMAKNQPASAGGAGDLGSIPRLGRSPRKRNGNPTLVFLPGNFQGQRSLVGYMRPQSQT